MTKRKPRKPEANNPLTFCAIDFETADSERDSACAVALVRASEGRITGRLTRLIRPPRRRFEFSYLHGISWEDVKDEPAFGDVWREARSFLAGARFLAAHNAPFDRSVLLSCCGAAGLRPPALPFVCTVRLARQVWDVYPTKLPDVCRYLRIPLEHHDPSSDAEACARIVLDAIEKVGVGGIGVAPR